jgi:hypothetical protein
MILFFIALFGLADPTAAAEVAFIESYDHNGRRVQLELNGQFMHVAIRVGAYWFHAHPSTGVELTPTLERYGHRIVRLVNKAISDPSSEQVYRWLGKGFDHSYSWGNHDSTYCSRLVANLLGIGPLPMQFAAERWQVIPQKPVGELGLSPDDLFRILRSSGYSENKEDCASFLASDEDRGRTLRMYQ